MNKILSFIVPTFFMSVAILIVEHELLSFLVPIIWNCLPFYLLCRLTAFPSMDTSSLALRFIPFLITYIVLLGYVIMVIVLPDAFLEIALLTMPVLLSIAMIPFYWLIKLIVIIAKGINRILKKATTFDRGNQYSSNLDNTQKVAVRQIIIGFSRRVTGTLSVVVCMIIMIGGWEYYHHIRINNIYDAILLGKNQDVQKFIEKGIDLNSIDPEWGSPLYSACRLGEIETVKYILSFGVDVNLGNIEGMTPLMATAKRGKIDIVKLLLSYGADCQLVDKKGNSALYYAKNERNYEIEKLLNDAGCD